MPACVGKWSVAEIWAVLAFIKSHWKPSELREARKRTER
jgi:hypothetical protein